MKHPLILCLFLVGGCGSSAPRSHPRSAELIAEEARTIALLQKGEFDSARTAAEQLLARDRGNPPAHLIVAITGYKAAGHQFASDLRTVSMSVIRGGLNLQYLRYAFEQVDSKLATVETDLAAGAADQAVSLELCLACWEVDWNHDGRIDERDRLLLQIEQDEKGEPFPEGDARRRPTFRFDVGDIYWAQAMVAFQRVALNLVLAYLSPDLEQMVSSKMPEIFTLHLVEPKRVAAARELVLAGLAHADRARRAYLAETDDDREWVPNPRQQSHPLPLPVDQALYATWEGIIGDVTRLMRSEQGIDLSAIAKLERMDHPPSGFVDIGKLFSRPRDLVFNRDILRHTRQDPNASLASVLGDAYLPTMKPSPLVGRLERISHEIKRGEESFARKLRYLLWLN